MNIKDFSDDAFAGYLAGMLDGEGCIEIHPRECGIRIRIANIFKPALQGICDRLGYGRIEEYRRPRESHFKRLYCYAVSNSHDCRLLLTMVRPLIQIKAERADYALTILARIQKRGDDLDERNREIFEAVKSGEMKKLIAERFGISPQLVSRIHKGHTWPGEIKRMNARKGIKKGCRPMDQIFRLHGEPLSSPCR